MVTAWLRPSNSPLLPPACGRKANGALASLELKVVISSIKP